MVVLIFNMVDDLWEDEISWFDHDWFVLEMGRQAIAIADALGE